MLFNYHFELKINIIWRSSSCKNNEPEQTSILFENEICICCVGWYYSRRRNISRGKVIRDSLKEINGWMKAGIKVKYGCYVLGRDVYKIQSKKEEKLIQEKSQAKRKIIILTKIWFSKQKKSGMWKLIYQKWMWDNSVQLSFRCKIKIIPELRIEKIIYWSSGTHRIIVNIVLVTMTMTMTMTMPW